MSFIPRPQEIYQHFKGGLYQVTAIAEHSETGEWLVIYQAMQGDFKTYARPLSMFVDRVDESRYPEAASGFRFRLQGPDAGRQTAECEGEERAETGNRREKCLEDAGQSSGGCGVQGGVAGAPTPRQSVPEGAEGTVEGQELKLDPLLLEFLDSDSYEQKLNILAGLHHRITDEMLTTMAISCDLELNDGEIEERYEALRACLLTLERYECNRLR